MDISTLVGVIAALAIVFVVQMLEGELSPELKEKWAWDRERPDPALFADFPRFEMKDLLDESKPLKAKL